MSWRTALAAVLVLAGCSSGSSSAGPTRQSSTVAYAGKVKGSSALIAIEITPGGVGVYVCDGAQGHVRLASLLSGGPPAGNSLDLTNADEDHITARITATGIAGTFTPAGLSSLSFEAAATDAPVYYELEQPTDAAAVIVARWIVAGGDQRGALRSRRSLRAAPPLDVAALAATIGGALVHPRAASLARSAIDAERSFSFTLVASPGMSGCLPRAAGAVLIRQGTHNDVMTVSVDGLPRGADLAVFVIERPNKPFGVSWYQTDLRLGGDGTGSVSLRGVFNVETFTVAPGTLSATHQYHLGLWFDDPAVPFRLGCERGQRTPSITPFNGRQHAGVQVLNTANFADDAGPLSHVQA